MSDDSIMAFETKQMAEEWQSIAESVIPELLAAIQEHPEAWSELVGHVFSGASSGNPCVRTSSTFDVAAKTGEIILACGAAVLDGGPYEQRAREVINILALVLNVGFSLGSNALMQAQFENGRVGTT